MSEAKASVVGRIGNWIKAGILALGGLVSGALAMYATPLVERVVKPSRPLANFAYEVQGAQVTFQDRSTGSDGWWDFGDGSALEPYVPDQKTLTHTYARPGGYTAKLVVRSFLGDENERSVNVQIDDSAPAGVSIDAFTVQALQGESYAPATFRITAKVAHAEQCIWACGAEHPIEVVFDPAGQPERYVTFAQSGQHTIRLAAVQGKNLVQKETTVRVNAPPPGLAMAVLNVSHQATRVEKVFRPYNFKAAFPEKSKEAVYRFREEIKAWSDCTFTQADFTTAERPLFVKNAKVEIAKDGKKVIVSGELHKPATPPRNGPALPMWTVGLKLVQEKVGPAQVRPGDSISTALRLPGKTVLPMPQLPAGWQLKNRQMGVALMDGQRQAWQGSTLPKNAAVTLQGRLWRISADEVNNQLIIEATPAEGRLGLAGN